MCILCAIYYTKLYTLESRKLLKFRFVFAAVTQMSLRLQNVDAAPPSPPGPLRFGAHKHLETGEKFGCSAGFSSSVGGEGWAVMGLTAVTLGVRNS